MRALNNRWLCLSVIFLRYHAFAFHPVKHPSSCWRKETSPLFYKSGDDDVTSCATDNDHNRPPAALTQKTLDHTYLAIPLFQEAQELWSQEWHDSFIRNDLVDFVPPLSSQLNCLLVGDDGVMSKPHLPGQAPPIGGFLNGMDLSRESPSPGSSIVNKLVRSQEEEEDVFEKSARNRDEITSPMIRRRLFGGSTSLVPHHDEKDFDCILDRGLMDELLTTARNNGSASNVGLLLLEATRHIREYGVYVMVTKHGTLSTPMKEYLVNIGKLLGMEWKFDLDGISDFETNVSVARKYFKGELPSAGRLAKMEQPRPSS